MNKEEILKEIEKTKEHLANMEKMLKGCSDRWKPKPSQEYYCVDDSNVTRRVNFNTMNAYDRDRIKTYNCFQTREQAEQEAEKILIRRQLEDIARRLNKSKEFDWGDKNQHKWFIVYNTTYGFETYSVSETTTQGVVYCLDKGFLNTAIEEIGEERLKVYLRGK